MNVRPDNTTVIPTPTVPTSKDHLIVRVNQVIKEMAHFAQVRNIREYRCSESIEDLTQYQGDKLE